MVMLTTSLTLFSKIFSIAGKYLVLAVGSKVLKGWDTLNLSLAEIIK